MPFDIKEHATVASALDAYAAFHRAALSPDTDTPHQHLVFVPNQYGLGNRLRAMKASLLVAMLTGRVFHVRWDEPYPIDSLLQPEKIDWRLPTNPLLPVVNADAPRNAAAAAEADILCLPFATAPRAGNCALGLTTLQRGDLRKVYGKSRVLEVHTFTDLNIYLAGNPHYAPTLARLGKECPKRMGCLYNFLFSPQPAVRERLEALLGGGEGGGGVGGGHVGVQVRNRLWTAERYKIQNPGGIPGAGSVAATAERVLYCMDRYVPPHATVFFTADEDHFYAVAKRQWGTRVRTVEGGVFMPWSRGGKVDAASLGDAEQEAVFKAIVDWFALQRAERIVYTHQSSFGKTAAESSDAPNIDVNHTRCLAADARWGAAGGGEGGAAAVWEVEWGEAADGGVTYDTSAVPGAPSGRTGAHDEL